MTLQNALTESDIEVAELWTDGKMIVVGSDEEAGGYEISFKIGDMPPYARDHAETPAQAEQIIGAAGIPYTIGSEDWEARQGEQ